MDIVILATTDMHGRLYTTNALSGEPIHNSMPKVAAVVKAEREENSNVIVIDNGDTIQGTAETSYFVTQEPYETNPMMHAMRLAGYDVWVLGNHEFNYPWTIMKNYYDYVQDDEEEDGTPVAVICANLIVDDVDELRKVDPGAYSKTEGEPYFAPYIIKSFTTDNGKEVKVGILGLTNPNVPQWDVPSNYPGLRFCDSNNTKTKLSYEVEKWVPIMKKAGCDVIIVSAHSGAESSLDSTSNENQIRDMIANTNGIDLVIAGHDHSQYIRTQANKDGKEIYILNPGGRSVGKAVITVKVAPYTEKKTVEVSKIEQIRLDQNTPVDTEVESAMRYYYEKAVEFVNQPLGQVEGEWVSCSNNEHVLTQTNTLDLIHRAQIAATYSYSGGPAQVSITSPVINGTYAPQSGPISLKDVYNLYRYDNTLYMVEMTGRQLKAWMSKVADKYTINPETNKAEIKRGESIFGIDTFYGVNYEYHLWKEPGNRLANVTLADGTPVTDDMVLRVAINNYRLSGEYGFAEATGISESDAIWSSVRDLGIDRGQVRILIAEYIRQEGTIRPYSQTHWRILTEEALEAGILFRIPAL